MNTETFFRGMAWHDIAKPLYLSNVAHSRLGFLLLEAAGYPEEGLLSLAHAAIDGNLRDYFRRDDAPSSLPPQLALATVLDRLAAASYSLMETGLDFSESTFQNPFSRLPIRSEVVERIEGQSTFALSQNRRNRVFQEDFVEALVLHGIDPAPIQALLLEKRPPLAPLLLSAGKRETLLELLLDYQREYPERTYPPMNDTSLHSHTRLSAILAFVVQRNLEAQNSRFLDHEIRLQGNELVLGDQSLDAFLAWENRGLSAAQSIVCNHLDARLVRVVFSGSRQLFESAGRIGDLLGARALADRIRALFKESLAGILGVPGLSEMLWLGEGQFDLILMLPGSLSSEDIDDVLSRANEQTVARLVNDDLMDLLVRDFRDARDPVPFAKFRDDLVSQMRYLGLNRSVVPVVLPEIGNFDRFAAAYGRSLHDAYVASLEGESTLPALLADAAAYLSAAEDDDVCSACGVYPVFGEFRERLLQDEYLQKATYTFRDEPEALCISCIGRRVLAHGEVGVDALAEMVTLGGDDRLEAKAIGNLSLPPGLVQSSVCRPGDFVDLGAAFARRKREAPDRLELFPTVGYAADHNSNVALISLAPTDRLYKKLDFSPLAGEAVRPRSDRDLLRRDLNAYVAKFYRQVGKRSGEDLARQVVVAEAHVARVLERIRRLEQFFLALPPAIEASGVRVLTIDVRFPAVRVLVPAEDLSIALEALQEAVYRELLSLRAEHKLEPELLSLLAPPLLLGTVVVFKQKQALYLVMTAERRLLARLAEAADTEIGDGTRSKESGAWHGLRMGFADMRGTLSERGGWQAQVTLDNLDRVLALSRPETVDRRTIIEKATTAGRDELGEMAEKLAQARLYVRGTWLKLDAKVLDDLSRPEFFEPVYFLKSITRQ